MVCFLLDKNKDILSLIKTYKKNLNNEPDGNKLFNIFDCKFFVNIHLENEIIPFETTVEYLKKCDISGKNNFDFITLKSKPLSNEEIKLDFNKTLGFSVSCQYCNNCKEYTIKKCKTQIKVPYLTKRKKKKIEFYSKKIKLKYCLKDKSNAFYYSYYKQGNLYLDSFSYTIKKDYIKNKFIPYFGENVNNPLFKIDKWEIEAYLNNKIIELSDLEEDDIPQNSDLYKKHLFIYINPKGKNISLNECEIKYGDKLSFNIFVTYKNNKYMIKKIKNVPIGNMIINAIKKNNNSSFEDILNIAEVKYKNNLYCGNYMLKPDIINTINILRGKGKFSEINNLEKDRNNYYYNLQFIRCSISTNNLLDISLNT
jgi:hypothetical protein